MSQTRKAVPHASVRPCCSSRPWRKLERTDTVGGLGNDGRRSVVVNGNQNHEPLRKARDRYKKNEKQRRSQPDSPLFRPIPLCCHQPSESTPYPNATIVFRSLVKSHSQSSVCCWFTAGGGSLVARQRQAGPLLQQNRPAAAAAAAAGSGLRSGRRPRRPRRWSRGSESCSP